MKSDPRAAVTFADKLGLGSDAINLLGIGAERLAALRKEAAALSGITDEGQDSAEKFAAATGRIGIAADRVGRTIQTALAPVLAPLLTNLAEWVGTHNKDIQDSFTGIADGIKRVPWKQVGEDIERIGSIARGAAGYLRETKDAIDKFNDIGKPVSDFLNKVTGADGSGTSKIIDRRANGGASAYPRGAWGGGGAPGGGGSGSIQVSPSDAVLPADKAARGRAWHDEFVKQGMGDVQAWGAAANVLHENGGMVGGKPGDGGASTGGLQWRGTRRTNYRAMFGHDPGEGTIAENVKFLMWELNNTEKGNTGRFNAARTPGEAAAAMSEDIIRPADRMGNRLLRAGTAERLARTQPMVPRAFEPKPEDPDLTRGGRVPAPKPEEPDLTRGGRLPQLLAPTPAPASAAASSDNNGQSAVHIHLTADNLPDSMGFRTRTEGAGAEVGSVTIRRAMPQDDFSRGY